MNPFPNRQTQRILRYVDKVDRITHPCELMRDLYISPSRMTELLRTAAQQGYLHRLPHRKGYHLSEQGKHVMEVVKQWDGTTLRYDDKAKALVLKLIELYQVHKVSVQVRSFAGNDFKFNGQWTVLNRVQRWGLVERTGKGWYKPTMKAFLWLTLVKDFNCDEKICIPPSTSPRSGDRKINQQRSLSSRFGTTDTLPV